MGTVLQERITQQCLQRFSIRESEWEKNASWSNKRFNVGSNKMGRRTSQRKCVQPQCTFSSQEKNDKKLQQRRKHRPNIPSTKRNAFQHSAQGTSESKSPPLFPQEDRMEPKVQSATQHSSHREHKHTDFRVSSQKSAIPCNRLFDSCPDLLERLSLNPQVGSLNGHEDDDSGTDMSESERLCVLPSGWVPPKLKLRAEVIEAEDYSSHSHRLRRHGHYGFDFPDCLPPPFNSWSLGQLAVFYNMQGRVGPQPRPGGSLERYLERLLQLEWHQIQTVKEESGKSMVSDVISSSHRSSAAAPFRLSSPKCILQCQRAFPFTLFSSPTSHSALQSHCTCTLCRVHYSACNTPCCLSIHNPTHQSRAVLEHRGPLSLPNRSYSESRVHSSHRRSASQDKRFSSPARTNSYLRWMQASGNIRNTVQGINMKPQCTVRDSVFRPGRDCLGERGDGFDYRTEGLRKRSGSEQRRVAVERQKSASEKRRSCSECRRIGTEQRRTPGLKERKINPDAVTATMDNLPVPKNDSVKKPNRLK